MERIVRIVEDSQQPHLLGPGLPADALLCQEVDDGVEVIVAVQHARDLAEETEDLERGRHQPLPQHHSGQVLDLHCYLLAAEVEWLVMVEWLAEMDYHHVKCSKKALGLIYRCCCALPEEHDGLHVPLFQAADSAPVRKPSWRECCSTPAQSCSRPPSTICFCLKYKKSSN